MPYVKCSLSRSSFRWLFSKLLTQETMYPFVGYLLTGSVTWTKQCTQAEKIPSLVQTLICLICRNKKNQIAKSILLQILQNRFITWIMCQTSGSIPDQMTELPILVITSPNHMTWMWVKMYHNHLLLVFCITQFTIILTPQWTQHRLFSNNGTFNCLQLKCTSVNQHFTKTKMLLEKTMPPPHTESSGTVQQTSKVQLLKDEDSRSF